MQDDHQLDIWQRAMTYAVQVYELSAQLPDAERYNLGSQLRRGVASVPLNIAEGSGCASPGEFARFLGYAYRSLKEVMTALELCRRIYPSLPDQSVMELIGEGDQIAPMIRGLVQRLDVRVPSSRSGQRAG